MTPTRFQQEINTLATTCQANIQELLQAREERSRKQRRGRAERDFRYFAHRYFPHYLNRGESVLHVWLFQRLQALFFPVGAKVRSARARLAVSSPRRGVKLAIAAPRGEAKSTLVTQIFSLWCIAGQHKHYLPIIMDSHGQAVVMLAAIKAELVDNPGLATDFPEICGQGSVWKEGVIVTRNDIKLQAFGSGQRLRGLRHRNHRPDLVILDDLENDANSRSPEQRDRLEQWLNQAVLKLGPPDDSLDVICVGTLLHADSVLARLLANPLWEGARFQAILQWPDRLDLWDRWEEILRHAGEAAADTFYQEQTTAMEAGAQLSWPGTRTLEVLMKIRARDGRGAFEAELQNNPTPEDSAFGAIHFWVQENRDWVFFGAVDPSMGKSGRRGDPSAILIGGFDRATGVLDVVEADIRRRLPDQIIMDIIAYQLQYDCRLWVIETVQFQEFFKDELVKRSASMGTPVPAKGIKPIGDKGLRIGSLQPHVSNGLIRLHQRQGELLRQMRHWGGQGEEHDDGPDALHMLWKIAVEGSGRLTRDHRSLGPRTTIADTGGGMTVNDRGFGSIGGRNGANGY